MSAHHWPDLGVLILSMPVNYLFTFQKAAIDYQIKVLFVGQQIAIVIEALQKNRSNIDQFLYTIISFEMFNYTKLFI